MPQNLPDYSRAFDDHIRDFILTADEANLAAIFPGHIVSPGDSLFPVYLRVKEPFFAFIVRMGAEKSSSLCFSRIQFLGTVDGIEKLRNVSKFAVCSQSSGHAHMQDAAAGISEEYYANNVHTSEEDAPWWRADFPENIRVRHIYFYRRVDWAVIHERHLRILGETADGHEQQLFYPQGDTTYRQTVADNTDQALSSLVALRASVADDKLEEFDASVESAISDLSGCIAGLDSAESLPRKNWLQRGVKAVAEKIIRLPAEIPVKSVSLAERQSIADRLLGAVYVAVGGAKDFGSNVADALSVPVASFSASELRFRVYGETPPGMAGAEITVSGQDEPLLLNKGHLEFKHRPPGFGFPESFSIGLLTQVRSRVVSIGDVYDVEAIKIWNLSKQHAGNSFFLEISGRKHKEDDWTLLYDHGAPYRHAIRVLRLADYLIRSAWTPGYAKLLGKIFTQYRRRRMMKPVAKLVRDKEVLNKAVFAGAKTIPPQTRFAAPLVLGKHGLQVPVACRPEKEVMAHLVEIRDKVRATGHTPMFMYGTLLGAIREKDFIPHDDDLDLAVIIDGLGPDDLMAERERLIGVFNEASIPCQSGSQIAPLIHCHRGPVTIDIFVLGHKDNTVYWPHTALKIVPESADIFLPATTIEFKGETFDAPANPEAVSEARYGADWHIPNPAFEF